MDIFTAFNIMWGDKMSEYDGKPYKDDAEKQQVWEERCKVEMGDAKNFQEFIRDSALELYWDKIHELIYNGSNEKALKAVAILWDEFEGYVDRTTE